MIIFSKDRAAQLDALLRSIRERVEGWEKRSLWSVVFTASSPEFDKGYEIVRAEHRSGRLRFIDERWQSGDFKSIVIETMQRQHQANGAAWCMFLVDDIIFKTQWRLDGGKPMRRLSSDPRVLCLSLRMCPRYDYCYPERRPVKPPLWRFSGAGTGERPAATGATRCHATGTSFGTTTSYRWCSRLSLRIQTPSSLHLAGTPSRRDR